MNKNTLLRLLSLTNCKTGTKAASAAKSKSFFSLLMVSVMLLLSTHAMAQTYSQTFTSGVSGTSGTPQGIAWNSFVAALPSSGITGFNFRGTNDPVGLTCTDATVAQNIADALRTSGFYSGTANGHTWNAGTGCGPGVYFEVDNTCSCGASYALRPTLGNSNWGGLNGSTCGAGTQTMTLQFISLSFDNGSPQSLTVCQNASATSINSFLTATGPTGNTFTWSVISGPSHGTLGGFSTTASSGTSISPSGTTYTPTSGYSGSDAFTIQVSDGVGGTTSTTINVTVNPLPGAISGTTTLCASGGTTTLSDAVSGGTWSTSTSSVATVNSSTGVVTGGTAGTATITYTMTSGCGFTTIGVYVLAQPTVSGGSNVTICSGNSTPLTGTGAATYTWAPSTGLSATTGSSVTANPTSTTIYTVIGTSSGSGSQTFSYSGSVVAYTVPAGVTSLTIAASGAQGGAQFAYGAGGGTGANMAGTFSVTPGQVLRILAGGQGASAFYVGGGGGGSFVWDNATNTLLIAAGGGGGAGVLYGPGGITGVNATTSNNGLAGGGFGGGGTSGNGGTNPGIDHAGGGTGWFSGGTNGTAHGCTFNCTGGITPLSGGSGGTGGGAPGYNADGGFGGGGGGNGRCNAVGGGGGGGYSGGGPGTDNGTSVEGPGGGGGSYISGTLTSSSVGNTGNGIVTISYTGTTCSNSAVVTVSVNPVPSAIGGTASVCVGLTTTLTDASAFGAWTSSVSSVATIGSSTGVVSGVSAGTSTISYSFVTGCGVSKIVTVNPLPAPITGVTNICASGGSTTLSDAGGGTWSTSTSSVATVNSSTGVVTGGSVGTTTITYKLPTGCINTTIISVNPLPVVSAGSNVAICNGGNTPLTASGATIYSWSPSTGLSATTGSSVTANPTSTTTYTVTGTTSNTTTFNYTGAVQLFTVPSGVTSLNVRLWGAEGGGSEDCSLIINTDGGLGGYSQGTLAVTPGQVLNVYVGGKPATFVGSGSPTAGFNGGSKSGQYGGGGGGASDIRVSGTALTDRAIVAGGGGGGNTGCPDHGAGGNGGGLTGNSGSNGSGGFTPAGGGTQAAGGGAGSFPGSAGSFGVGAGGGNYHEAGGGGGYYGGGSAYAAGGGGGSSYLGGVTSGSTSIGLQSGNGVVIIDYIGTVCSNTATVTVTVNPVPAAISGPNSVCAGSNITLSDATSFGAWSSSSTVATVSGGLVNGVAVGTATISYTLATTCYATKLVTVNPQPVAISGTTTVCAGFTTGLSNATGGGAWTSSTSSVATINSSTGLVNGVAAGTATVTYTLPAGCFSTTVITVNPVPAAITNNNAVCVGATNTLSDATGFGQWTSSNTNASIVLLTGVLTGNAAGTSTISYTLSTGCYITATATVNPLPGSITGTPTVCVGATTALTDAGGGTWTTSTSSVATVGLGTGIVNGVAAGTSTITYTLATGCNTTTPVTVYPLPTAIIGTPVVCIGLNTTLSDATAGGTWSSSTTAASIGSSSGIMTGLVAGNPTITYKLTTTGCYVTALGTVNPLPAAISGTTTVCAGLTTGLSDVDAGGAWTSSTSSVATIGSTTGLVNAVAAGTTTITYTLPTGCINTTTVTVNPLPSAILGTPVVCVGLNTTLSDATAGGTWSSSNTTLATIG
ncbi:MAG: surface protein, partial [Flavipsychrobacter sp.]|nr:surface protein [Flavipsychrobacter sp.]